MKNKIITALLSVMIYYLFLAFFELFNSPVGISGLNNISEITSALGMAYGALFYAIPVYFLLGIPVSCLVDYITGKLHLRSAVKLYAVKFILYFIVAIVLFEFVMQYGDLATFIVMPLLPIFVFFNLQFFLYKEYGVYGK